MGKRNATAEAVIRYAVHSVNSGALVGGPYDARSDAKRECERLNKDASQGRTAAVYRRLSMRPRPGSQVSSPFQRTACTPWASRCRPRSPNNAGAFLSAQLQLHWV